MLSVAERYELFPLSPSTPLVKIKDHFSKFFIRDLTVSVVIHLHEQK